MIQAIAGSWLFKSLGPVPIDEIESRVIDGNYIWRKPARKVWVSGEVLSVKDLNGQFDRIDWQLQRNGRTGMYDA